MNRNPWANAALGATALFGYTMVKNSLDDKYDLNMDFEPKLESFDADPESVTLVNRLSRFKDRAPNLFVDFMDSLDSLLRLVKVLRDQKKAGHQPTLLDRPEAKSNAKCAVATLIQIRNTFTDATKDAEARAQLDKVQDSLKKLILRNYKSVVALTSQIPFPYQLPRMHVPAQPNTQQPQQPRAGERKVNQGSSSKHDR